MQKAERLALATARGVLEPDGLEVALMASARHPHFLVSAPDGWSRSFTMACSARADDQCQVNYARQKANALLREFRASRPRPDARAAPDPRGGDQRAPGERPAGLRQPPGHAPHPARLQGGDLARPKRRGDRQARRR
jgi:hypothetical protein